jgi:hypothetical protein
MTVTRFVCTAVLMVGLAQTAAAQAPARAAAARAPGVVATIDVTRLPIDLKRIERGFRQAEIREEHKGLDLRYFVQVFAPAPKIVLITSRDNIEHGPAPYGAPTHREMVDMMTPQHFRHSGGLDILNRR